MELSQRIVRNLQLLAKESPNIWSAVSASGYSITDLFFSHLEQVSIQDSRVRPARDYFVEVLRERLALGGLHWSRAERRQLGDTSFRSEYLDFLDSELERGAWPELKDVERARTVIDPSYLKYTRLKYASSGTDDRALWTNFLLRYSKEKDRECERLEPRILAEFARRSGTPDDVRALADRVFDANGLRSAPASQRGTTLVYSRLIDTEGLILFCELSDLRGLVPGMWPLRIGFCSQKKQLDRLQTEPKKIIVGDLEMFLPGGQEYMRHLGNWRWLVLGCVVAGVFVGHLAEKYAQIQSL